MLVIILGFVVYLLLAAFTGYWSMMIWPISGATLSETKIKLYFSLGGLGITQGFMAWIVSYTPYHQFLASLAILGMTLVMLLAILNEYSKTALKIANPQKN